MLFAPEAVRRSQEADFGSRRGLFRRWRPVRQGMVWLAAVPVIGLSILLAFAATPLAALAPVLVMLAVLVPYRLGDPQWVAVYEQAVVYAHGPYIRTARWDDIPRIESDAKSVALDLGGTVVTLSGFSRQEELVARLDAELQPRALARGKAQLAAAGRAEFPPLTITPERMLLAREGLTCPGSVTEVHGIPPGPWYSFLTIDDIHSVIGPYVKS